ncbi:hypothetical protein BDY21DRAFT_283922 [Lineolata rhizophorae]|uniref:DUF159 domain protein n=1 Tax=Lineolata rhizophorae TaxID=578093 RepID=A0A6A6P459_9PEZI|nr:hypothetical protein BDY21DRAFT_283922 [Lineolata rhizophorae]
MCGRYALALRPSEVRHELESSQMPCDDAPADGAVKQSHNFAPGYYGLVYRADVPDRGAGDTDNKVGESADMHEVIKEIEAQKSFRHPKIGYKLQAMKWGLIPFWTKRTPDYGSVMRTINCRDDSLIENRGMWTTMKRQKRCVVVCQGFYEWLKKNGGKEKIPHFVKRKDGQLMCFAGLWDCVKFEDSDEKLFTYSIITTNSNKHLSFLHDRMPVILDNGSEEMRKWLDPARTEWTIDLQSLLKPYGGELECYPVSRDVGKVGNDSPSFVIPINSSENKSNIANFFGNQKKSAKREHAGVREQERKDESTRYIARPKREGSGKTLSDSETAGETRNDSGAVKQGVKRELSDSGSPSAPSIHADKASKVSPNKGPLQSPSKSIRTTRNVSGNAKQTDQSPSKGPNGTRKITAFFRK